MAGKDVSAVVLAAGYGTRLERDLLQDTSGLVLHLLNSTKFNDFNKIITK
jgi:CTP:molybdopterin cytidylyltransferase MocA